jgi:mRNA-degrading endonuclease RelE of RelBE toxin-antitoxin system
MQKFLARLQKARARRIIPVLRRIEANDLHGLNIKLLSGKHHILRCRVGDIRILFVQNASGNTVIDVDDRKDIYRRLNR